MHRALEPDAYPKRTSGVADFLRTKETLPVGSSAEGKGALVAPRPS